MALGLMLSSEVGPLVETALDMTGRTLIYEISDLGTPGDYNWRLKILNFPPEKPPNAVNPANGAFYRSETRNRWR